MASTISVNKLKVGIDLITQTLSFGVLMDSIAGTPVGDAKAKLGTDVIMMLHLLMDDIRDMDPLKALH